MTVIRTTAKTGPGSAMADGSRQLGLDVALADHATFDNFLAGPNEAALRALHSIDELPAPVLWLSGMPGVGKSHLLQAVCAGRSSAAYLPCAEVRQLSPAVFDGYERFELVCLDDIHLLLGSRHWEEALFGLYARLFDSKARLLCAAPSAPASYDYCYRDLRSRMTAATVVHLEPLTDAQRIDALKLRADLRGLELNDEVAAWWLRHYRRDMKSLCHQLDTLDRASLAAQRKLTIPFIRSILPPGA